MYDPTLNLRLPGGGAARAAPEPAMTGKRAEALPEDGFWIAEHAEDLVGELLQIRGVETHGPLAAFIGAPHPQAAARFADVAGRLQARGLEARLEEESEGRARVLVEPLVPTTVPASRPWLSLGLLLVTLLTTTWAGALHHGVNLLETPGRWMVGLPYALALLGILGVHEMGHYLVARRRGVPVSLPYFIPAPFFLGTFGAFIRMGGRVRDRSAYFDVAVAGPLAGLAASLVALLFGMSSASAGTGHGMDPRSSALVYLLYRLVGGEAGVSTIELGPVGFAGWLGVLVTALNLIPVGQLDGGHLAYAVLGRRRAAVLGGFIIGLLVAGGLLYSPHLLMWAALIWVVSGTGHPPAQNELTALGTGRRALAYGTLALLFMILLRWPG